ncbi:MAG: SPOR domain-containing protein [Pseudomonadaceae bacterium]|nr:SPOR domain-containing protein [Pseudomonadaceae bacterium]
MAAKKKPAPKRGASRYQAPPRKPVPGWVWLTCGLLIGAFVVFLLQLEPGRDEIKRIKDEKPRQSSSQANKPTPNAQPAGPAKPKYDFYTLLPESEVIVPPDAVPPPPAAALTPEQLAKADAARAEAALNGQVPPALPTASTTPPTGTPTPPPSVAKAPLTTQFFLQAGSFRKQADADKVRAQIILLGQNVQVESGTVREEIWYRVLVGPFASREQLGAAQKQLAASGFGNLLLQQRQSR